MSATRVPTCAAAPATETTSPLPAAVVIRSTVHVQPSTAPGRYSSTLAARVAAPCAGRHVTRPHGVGMPPNPASRNTAIRRGAGCGPSCRCVAHLTTAASPTITDSFVWSTPTALSPDADRSVHDRIMKCPLVIEPCSSSQHIEQCFGDPFSSRCAPPLPIRVADHRNCRKTVPVGDDGQALAFGEVERVERLRQPTPDVVGLSLR